MKRIFAAGADVAETEPPIATSALFHLENYFITPHVAWTGPQSRHPLSGHSG